MPKCQKIRITMIDYLLSSLCEHTYTTPQDTQQPHTPPDPTTHPTQHNATPNHRTTQGNTKPNTQHPNTQPSSDVSAIVFNSDADEIPSNVSAPVLISVALFRMSQLLCSFPMLMQIPSTVSAPVLTSGHFSSFVSNVLAPVLGLRLKHNLRLSSSSM